VEGDAHVCTCVDLSVCLLFVCMVLVCAHASCHAPLPHPTAEWTSVDITMYAFMSAVKRDIGWYSHCPIRHYFQTKKNLMEYVDRVAERLA
jgi:hypothetical protein